MWQPPAKLHLGGWAPINLSSGNAGGCGPINLCQIVHAQRLCFVFGRGGEEALPHCSHALPYHLLIVTCWSMGSLPPCLANLYITVILHYFKILHLYDGPFYIYWYSRLLYTILQFYTYMIGYFSPRSPCFRVKLEQYLSGVWCTCMTSAQGFATKGCMKSRDGCESPRMGFESIWIIPKWGLKSDSLLIRWIIDSGSCELKQVFLTTESGQIKSNKRIAASG